jgi:cytochrome c oxidase subunit 2
LHDYFVPQFRARMNMVPGQISWFWFTPTRNGRFESMCAQLCGTGHPVMKGIVVVEDEAAFRAWHDQLPKFGAAKDTGAPLSGQQLAQMKGCVGCHTIDGSAGVGPTWKGLFGKTETMEDGTTALVDEAYLRSFIRNPTSRDVKGFPNVMPPLPLSDAEIDALVDYIKKAK